MIVKITFTDLEGEVSTLLVGNNYKKWDEHFSDYVYMATGWYDDKTITKCGIYEINNVVSCKNKWISSGGLKWCAEESVTEQLRQEAKLLKLATPRKYEDFKFYSDSRKFDFCKNLLNKRLRHLESASAEEIIKIIKFNNAKFK